MKRFLLSTASLITGFAFVLILATSVGCAWFAVEVPQPIQNAAGADNPAPKPASLKPKSVEELEKELTAAKEAQVKADQLVELKEKQLRDAKINERQNKLYWLVGICFLGLLGCVAGAICISGLAKYFTYGGIACAAMALLCLGVAELLPYMPYILLGFGIIGGGALFAWWRLDHKGLHQVVTAVEGIKEKVPDYKTHFRQFIDGDVDAWLNRTRKNLGLLGKK